MSTDRKLLELAAKAVGIVIDKSTTNGGGAGNTGFDMLGNAVLDWHNNIKWNPLTNDGDALRVAVKLNLIVECMKGQSAARTFDSKHAGACDFPAYRQDGCKRAHEPDQYAATRRAIVLAAASIGKAMP